jgi:ferredoxin-type protein NapF
MRGSGFNRADSGAFKDWRADRPFELRETCGKNPRFSHAGVRGQHARPGWPEKGAGRRTFSGQKAMGYTSFQTAHTSGSLRNKFIKTDICASEKNAKSPRNHDPDQQISVAPVLSKKGRPALGREGSEGANMANQDGRRAFLRGRFTARSAMRPFGALPPMAFEEACTGCGDCARACAENIICKDSEGFAVINFKKGECTFCGDCIEACETGALGGAQTWTWRARVSEDCLSQKGVHCRACQDFCDEQAIRFQLRTGGRAEPQFDLQSCTGCGACAAPCPVNAIKFTQISQPMEASNDKHLRMSSAHDAGEDRERHRGH